MPALKSVLVDIDGLAAVHPALEQGAALARLSGARLKLVDVLPSPDSPRLDDEWDTVVNSRRDRLAVIARSALDVIADFELLVGQPSIALVKEVVRLHHDLLIRSHARDLVAPSGLRGVDLELCRSCPCPLWAVGPSATTAPARIVAAVRATQDKLHLDRKVIETALHLAQLQGAPVIVLHAWTVFGESVLRRRVNPDVLSGYVEDAERSARHSVNVLLNSFGGRLSVSVELRRGIPEQVIPSFAVSHGVDLVVAGTVARRGVAGLIVGNTAERLLNRLPCSMIVVKPDDFTVPKEVTIAEATAHSGEVGHHSSRPRLGDGLQMSTGREVGAGL